MLVEESRVAVGEIAYSQTGSTDHIWIGKEIAQWNTDALNGVIMLDDATSEAMERLATHHGMLDLQRPYAISPDMALPAPVISMVDEWLRR